jgi:NADH-quinone oxidoreductase subunit M
LNGFVGEVLVLAGTFARSRTFGSIAALGMILGAVYMLWMYQRVFLGKQTNPANAAMSDINLREKLILLPIILMMLWIGIYSKPFLSRMEASLKLVQQRMEGAQRGIDGLYQVKQIPGGEK